MLSRDVGRRLGFTPTTVSTTALHNRPGPASYRRRLPGLSVGELSLRRTSSPSLSRVRGPRRCEMAARPLPEGLSLGFIGAGKMAESIARGVAESGVLPPSRIRTAVRGERRRNAFTSMGVQIDETNGQVAERSDIVVLSVKPQIVKPVLTELKPYLTEEKILVSIAAGFKLNDLQEFSGHGRCIRVMPNTPSAVGQGASVVCLGEKATDLDGDIVARIFDAVGKTWTIQEKYFDAVTGLSGSGPAYMFIAIEAMADGGVAAGLPRDLALNLASQTVLGAATMATQSGKHPAMLKDDVTSPGGTTITGIRELERGAFRGTIMNAVVAAANRCRELSS